MIKLQSKTALLLAVGLIGLATTLAAVSSWTRAQDARPQRMDADDKRWQAVAPGRVEAWSGEIKLAAPVPGLIGEVLVKANDKVIAGEPLVRLYDNEVQSRVAAAEAQIAQRKRVRNDQSPSSRAADRRKAEDAVADAEKAIVDARATLDKVAADRRAGKGSDADLEAARVALTRAKDRLGQRKAELRRVEADSNTPLPSQAEGQLTAARAELWGAEAAVEKLTIRAPIDASVLQVNAKAGELAGPSATQPLVLLGDLSALRVRAELDERDLGEIKVGQPVLVRAAAFRGREFNGKVSFIAPLVEAGRISARGQRNVSDVDVVEVLIDLTEPGPLAVGMKVDVYFSQEPGKEPAKAK
jgi:HlyD family secretion protein